MKLLSGKKQIHHLKVCSTCRHWSYKYKGLCSRQNQGVGKFWTCEEWQSASSLPLPPARGSEASGPSAP